MRETGRRSFLTSLHCSGFRDPPRRGNGPTVPLLLTSTLNGGPTIPYLLSRIQTRLYLALTLGKIPKPPPTHFGVSYGVSHTRHLGVLSPVHDSNVSWHFVSFLSTYQTVLSLSCPLLEPFYLSVGGEPLSFGDQTYISDFINHCTLSCPCTVYPARDEDF